MLPPAGSSVLDTPRFGIDLARRTVVAPDCELDDSMAEIGVETFNRGSIVHSSHVLKKLSVPLFCQRHITLINLADPDFPLPNKEKRNRALFFSVEGFNCLVFASYKVLLFTFSM